MNDKEIGIRNNAITAFMGGVAYVKNKHWKDLMDVEVRIMGLEDLLFNLSWSWLIPVWAKIRFKLSPVQVINAITAIDEDNINELWLLISQVCIDWCKENNINLE